MFDQPDLTGKLKNMTKQFKDLKELIEKFHLETSIYQSDLNQLDRKQKVLLHLLLKKHFGNNLLLKKHFGNNQKLTDEHCLELLNQEDKKDTRKRNEEKIKQIWKRFLRELYDEFRKSSEGSKDDGLICEKDIKTTTDCESSNTTKAALPCFDNQNEEGNINKDILTKHENAKESTGISMKQDTWKDFYINLFSPQIKEGMYTLDLVLDICTEKTVGLVKKKGGLTEETNWKSVRKVAAMKKVPASFRYLVAKQPELKEKFLKYLSSENGVVKNMKKIIKKKLEKMFKQWEMGFYETHLDFDKFAAQIELQIVNSKFKLPWLLTDINHAVDYCKKDLESGKLKKEFEEIQKNHYSISKSQHSIL